MNLIENKIYSCQDYTIKFLENGQINAFRNGNYIFLQHFVVQVDFGLEKYKLTWILPYGSSILFLLGTRYINYLLTKDKVNFDLGKVLKYHKKIEKINYYNSGMKALHSKKLNNDSKKIVFEELVEKNYIMRPVPKKFKIRY